MTRQTLIECLNGSSQPIEFWKKWICQMSDLMIHKGNIQSGRQSLIRSIESLQTFISRSLENPTSRKVAISALSETLASLEFKLSTLNMKFSDSQSTFVEALHHIDQAIRIYKEQQKWREYSESLLHKCSLLVQYSNYFGGERKATTEALKLLETARSECDRISESVYRPGSFSLPVNRLLGRVNTT